MMDNSGNPALSKGNISRISANLDSSDVMTKNGALAKIMWLLIVISGFGIWSWGFTANNTSSAMSLSLMSSIAGFIIAMVIIFTKPNPLLITLYAALQGILLGSISFLFGESYQGIVQQAIVLTISITLGMLLLYTSGIVKVTKKLQSVIMIATLGVFIFYLLTFIIGLFSSSVYQFAYEGTSGLIIAVVVVLIAALNLLLDFDFITKGVKKELPKQFEWYSAFSIMVTLIWLYISILRLLFMSQK